jgi:hypothetical protein
LFDFCAFVFQKIPPDYAIVLSVEENSQIRRWIAPSRACDEQLGTITHDYKRRTLIARAVCCCRFPYVLSSGAISAQRPLND